MASFDLYVEPQFMRRMALEAINVIRKRTLAGLDKDGKPFAPYSSKPFVMPAGALTGKARKTLESRNRLAFFQTKAGDMWVVVLGGYKELKAAKRPQHGGTVNLTDTYKTLRALAVGRFSRNEVQIIFSTPQEAEKAYYHVVTGVGKNKTKRDFLGLSEEELEDIVTRLGIQEYVRIVT